MDYELQQPSQKSDPFDDIAPDAFAKISGTRVGVAELLRRHKSKISAELISHLFAGKYTSEDEIPPEIRRKTEDELKKINDKISQHVASIVACDGRIAEYIELSEYQLKNLAISLAELQYRTPIEKVSAAQAILGAIIPGATLESQFSRCCSASFWRRALSTRLARAKEQLFLRLGMVGTYHEKYASDLNVDSRELQLRKQQKWMRDTYLVPAKEQADAAAPKQPEIRLIDVVQRPEARFAKLYTFIKAMELLGEDSKLSSAMVTITLEPEWHPNPSIGRKQWNERSPREAHQSFCKRWQAIIRDLHRKGIRLSGLRVVEPHGDACPHYHIWLLYRPEHEEKIMLALMQYFPLRLKVSTASKSSSGVVTYEHIVYESREALVAGSAASCSDDSPAQVVFSKINPGVSKGASYAAKYLMMTLPVNFEENGKAEMMKGEDGDSSKGSSLPRVDSYRSVWGMSRGQLFGVAKCLTVWDELRKMIRAPENSILRDLWAKARGGAEEGRIKKGACQRGDALGFLKALGGLDAARNGKRNAKRLALARLVEEVENRHGDKIKKTVGILLVEKERKEIKSTGDGDNFSRSVWRTVTSIIASVKTKLDDWKFENRASDPIVEFRKAMRSRGRMT